MQYADDDRGNGSNDDENATELDLLKTINHPPPHAGEKAPEDVLTMRGVDVEGDAAGGGSLITRRLYRKLSKEQNDVRAGSDLQGKQFHRKGDINFLS